MKITQTDKMAPVELVARAIIEGNGWIETMEAEGQREVLQSSQLPRMGLDLGRCQAQGIKVRVDCEDPLFLNVELPAGLTIKATDHSMWSHLVDATGKTVARIFYKAAPYDRRAHIHWEDE